METVTLGHFSDVSWMGCHGNFGPPKSLVRGTKIPGKLVRRTIIFWGGGGESGGMLPQDKFLKI